MEQVEVKYAPGMRIIVRGEEWMVKKVERNSLGNQTLHVIGLSQLVRRAPGDPQFVAHPVELQLDAAFRGGLKDPLPDDPFLEEHGPDPFYQVKAIVRGQDLPGRRSLL